VGEEHFDGLMLYPVRDLLLGFLGDHSLPASEFLSGLARLMDPFPEEFRESQLLMLGSHDTERIRTSLGGRAEAVRLSTLVQFSLPGAPCIYYGDEIGLEGRKDPDSRRAFPWQPARWDSGLRDHVRRLIDLRRRLPALRGADTLPVLSDDERRWVAYERRSGQSSAVVVLNASDRPEEIHLPALGLLAKPAETLSDALGGAALASIEGRTRVTLPPYAGAVLVAKP
jgi:glycosidase